LLNPIHLMAIGSDLRQAAPPRQAATTASKAMATADNKQADTLGDIAHAAIIACTLFCDKQ
jgi:hypothetical protein